MKKAELVEAMLLADEKDKEKQQENSVEKKTEEKKVEEKNVEEKKPEEKKQEEMFYPQELDSGQEAAGILDCLTVMALSVAKTICRVKMMFMWHPARSADLD